MTLGGLQGCAGCSGLGQTNKGAALLVFGPLMAVGLLGVLMYMHQRSFRGR